MDRRGLPDRRQLFIVSHDPMAAMRAQQMLLQERYGGRDRGSATISISYTDNYDAPRDGIIMVRWPTLTAGHNIRIAQAFLA
jgi:hypothetical protein